MDQMGDISELSGGYSIVSVAVAISQLFEFTSSLMCLVQMDTDSVLVFPLQQLQECLASRSTSKVKSCAMFCASDQNFMLLEMNSNL